MTLNKKMRLMWAAATRQENPGAAEAILQDTFDAFGFTAKQRFGDALAAALIEPKP